MEEEPILMLQLLLDKLYTIPIPTESINTDGTMLIPTEILMEDTSLETIILRKNSHLLIMLELMT